MGVLLVPKPIAARRKVSEKVDTEPNPSAPSHLRSIRVRKTPEANMYYWSCSECDWLVPFMDATGNANSPAQMLVDFANHKCLDHKKLISVGPQGVSGA